MRILVLRVGRLGDMVMVAPAIRYLLDQHPDAEMTLVTSPDGRRLFGDFDPRLDEIWVFRTSNPGRRLSRMVLRLWLRHRHFGKKYCLETDERHHSILASVPGETVLFDDKKPDLPTHYSAQCLQLVGSRDFSPSSVSTPVFPVSNAGHEKAELQLASAGIQKNNLIIGLHPGFSARQGWGRRKTKHAKSWPIERWAELGRRLSDLGQKQNRRIRLIADLLPSDKTLGRRLAELGAGDITVFLEKPDFERYKALLARIDILVSPDSGPMHLASSLNTAVVALFSGNNPLCCGPFVNPDTHSIVSTIPLEHPDGIAALTVEQVYGTCVKQLSRIPAKTY